MPDAIWHLHWKACHVQHNVTQNVLMYDHHLCLFFHSDWDTSKTWFLNTPTVSAGDENRWPRIFFLMCGKSLDAKSGLFGGWAINSTFWSVNKALNWADVWDNDARTSKHSEYDYARNCQTFLWKYQISAGNTSNMLGQKCMDNNYQNYKNKITIYIVYYLSCRNQNQTVKR